MTASRPGAATREFLSKGFRSFAPAGVASKALALAGAVTAMVVVDAANAQPGPGACAPGSGINAVDTASPVTPNFLAGLKSVGIGTVIRYYDHPDETIRGKTLSPSEVKMIAQAQMQVAVVFQHHNDKIETFLDPTRGAADARRSLELAQKLGQPKGGTIYFGVDGDFPMPYVTSYFQQVNAVLKPAGYKVGVYGSGQVGKTLVQARLADNFWLANAKGWPGYVSAASSQLWSIKQDRTIPAGACFGVAVDPNVIQAGHEDKFGAWAPGGAPLVAERRGPPQEPKTEVAAEAREARPAEGIAAAATAARAQSDRLEYEANVAFAGVRAPTWDKLTEAQRETVRATNRKHHQEMQEFNESLHAEASGPRP